MKLTPVYFEIHQLPEWRFKKHKVTGKVFYRKEKNDFYYVMEHPSFKSKNSLDEGKTFQSLEDAGKAAESWIDLWYRIQGRILSFGHF